MLLFDRQGAVTIIKNTQELDQNLIAFRRDGSIQILSTAHPDLNLALYAPLKVETGILGAENRVETRKLIEKNGHMYISRNHDQKVTVTIFDPANPDVVFENEVNPVTASQSLVYLEILPSPMTISNEQGVLYLAQDVFKIKVDQSFDSFVIKTAPENVFAVSGGVEYAMGTQPIDIGRVLSATDEKFNPVDIVEQKLSLLSSPSYAIASHRHLVSRFDWAFSCQKNHLVSFAQPKLESTKIPLLSRLWCIW